MIRPLRAARSLVAEQAELASIREKEVIA
jgi:hypothetical protein